MSTDDDAPKLGATLRTPCSESLGAVLFEVLTHQRLVTGADAHVCTQALEQRRAVKAGNLRQLAPPEGVSAS